MKGKQSRCAVMCAPWRDRMQTLQRYLNSITAARAILRVRISSNAANSTPAAWKGGSAKPSSKTIIFCRTRHIRSEGVANKINTASRRSHRVKTRLSRRLHRRNSKTSQSLAARDRPRPEFHSDDLPPKAVIAKAGNFTGHFIQPHRRNPHRGNNGGPRIRVEFPAED